ncbi:hypothetical protein [Hymenobacter metallicola]|uniref:Uncharacterized protein n=1 Tax=Hymenobacter metallicola TaxID=2563114 RepID=A0A4Z0QFG0_9BACT|nr:hypothetical protein [Hymenobacter metallicola]TGE27442.1 hypothetical protein E5K02_13775 [Hymenobacter metallicola]
MPTLHPSALPYRLPLACGVTLALGLVVANVLADHFFAPWGILLTPVVAGGAVRLVAFTRPGYPLLQAALSAALIALHDCGIKLFGGGTHDTEGQGFVHVFLFFGLLVAFLVLVAAIDQQQASTRLVRRLAKFLFVALLMVHLALTANLGLGS